MKPVTTKSANRRASPSAKAQAKTNDATAKNAENNENDLKKITSVPRSRSRSSTSKSSKKENATKKPPTPAKKQSMAKTPSKPDQNVKNS